MAKDSYRYPDDRQPLSGTTDWYPDEFIFGITRGACAPARRNPDHARREVFEAGRGFEETYPKYPFAELVRLAIGIGGWLRRAGEKLRQGLGAKSHSRHFDGPTSSSYRWR